MRHGGPLTIREYWRWLAGTDITDPGTAADLLAWPPDVAALTSALLERSQAFRFVVSPPPGAAWPPPELPGFSDLARRTAEQWRAALDHDTAPPEQARQWWQTIVAAAQTPLADLTAGRPWPLCAALLALHAVADEACAGAAPGGPVGDPGALFRAQERELLTRTGSLSRLPADRVTQLPKGRTTSVGITHRSLSRYAATAGDGIEVVWHRAPLRRGGTATFRRHANVLVLPWPLRIRETDFVPVPGSVRRPEREPFGLFTYEPSEPLDLALLERLIDAAADEVDEIDVVVLPEGRLDEAQVAAVQQVLAGRRVPMLVSGLRLAPATPGGLPGNALHTSVLVGERWWTYRQHKHHRWFLDGPQIEAYNIAGALHPRVRWWEAMTIPPRSVHILDVGGGITVAAVVCEDLARLDGVAQLLRAVGPTLVVTLLLDGPQLASRWTARYASVLADDPGSAVLTVTPLGMALRSQPHGLPPSPVVALWKDPTRGLREIAVAPGAQAVLLKAVLDRSARYAADGRAPVDDVTDFYVAGVQHVTAADPRPGASASAAGGGEAAGSSAAESWTAGAAGGQGDPRPGAAGGEAAVAGAVGGVSAAAGGQAEPRPGAAGGEPEAAAAAAEDVGGESVAGERWLNAAELSALTAWAEAIASAMVAQRGVDDVVARAAPGASWRAGVGLGEPTPAFVAALHEVADAARRCLATTAGPRPAQLRAACDRLQAAGDNPAVVVVRAALDSVRLA